MPLRIHVLKWSLGLGSKMGRPFSFRLMIEPALAGYHKALSAPMLGRSTGGGQNCQAAPEVGVGGGPWKHEGDDRSPISPKTAARQGFRRRAIDYAVTRDDLIYGIQSMRFCLIQKWLPHFSFGIHNDGCKVT